MSCEENALHSLSLCKKECPKFEKSMHYHAAMAGPPVHQVINDQLKSKWKNSILISMMFDADSICILPKVLNPSVDGGSSS